LWGCQEQSSSVGSELLQGLTHGLTDTLDTLTQVHTDTRARVHTDTLDTLTHVHTDNRAHEHTDRYTYTRTH